MARRPKNDENTIDFSGYYNEPEVNPISMAMQLLGMEEKEQASKTANLMSWMQNQAEQRRAEQMLGLQREQLGETKAGNVEARRLAQAQEDRLGRALTEDVAYKKGQQEIERQKLIASALEKVVGVPQLSEEAKLLIANIPGIAEPYQQMVGKREVGAITPQLQAAYANKDAAKRNAAIKLIYGQMSPYARENVNWQDLNQVIPPTQPTAARGTTTPMGVVANIPVAARNIGRYAANVGPNIARSLGVETGTWPYEEFIDPMQFREAQALLSGSPPTLPQSVVPPYQYGVGTRR